MQKRERMCTGAGLDLCEGCRRQLDDDQAPITSDLDPAPGNQSGCVWFKARPEGQS